MERRSFVAVLAALSGATAAHAQFTGPSATGRVSRVADIQNARIGSYVTVTGHVVEHQRSNYFTFKDGSGTIRIEVEPAVWQGRAVNPQTTVRLLVEVDRGPAGRYLWVKSLEIVN